MQTGLTGFVMRDKHVHICISVILDITEVIKNDACFHDVVRAKIMVVIQDTFDSKLKPQTEVLCLLIFHLLFQSRYYNIEGLVQRSHIHEHKAGVSVVY